MNVITYKHDVPDPAFYNSIISKHKKKKRSESKSADYWFEMGRLYEARIDMINSFSKSNLILQHFYIVVLLGLVFIVFSLIYFDWNQIALNIKNPLLIAAMQISLVICLFLNIYLWFTRYPPSGARYFRKAIRLNPNFGDAYTYLGLIELRRRNRQAAYDYLEKALSLNSTNSNRIERKLKSLYEKEFISFFNKFSEQKNDREEMIQDQQNQMKQLHGQITYLENIVAYQNDKLNQSKWKSGYERKILSKEFDAQVSEIEKNYENRIESVKREAETEAISSANQKFADLTMEIMEEKARLEAGSFEKASKAVRKIIGNDSWNSLSEQTKKFLATSEQVYTVLSLQEDDPDYGLVGMELCKAVEVELNQKLVLPFRSFIKDHKHEFLKLSKKGEVSGRPIYFNHLAKFIDRKNYPDVNSITLGQYHFVLKMVMEGDYALRCYQEFLREKNVNGENVLSQTLLYNIEIVVFKYRNAIAHQQSLSKNDFEKLRCIVLTRKNSLIRKMSSL